MTENDDPYARWQNPGLEPLTYGKVTVGKHCQIHPLATIGTLPFTYKPDVLPRQRKDVKCGVVIGDDVEVMPLSNVDAGTERDTVIGDGTKIDRLVHVAHDSIIGKNCILVAGTIVGGFVTMEDDVYCGINVSLKPRIRLGRGAKIGAGAVVLHDVPPGSIMVGNPAYFLKLRYPKEWYIEHIGEGAYGHAENLKWNGTEWVI